MVEQRAPAESVGGFDPFGVGQVRREHAALVYESAVQHRAAVAAYVKAGLEAGERCVYILSDSALIEIVDALHEGGVDVPGEAARGSFRVLRAQQIYLRSGSFDASTTIDLIRASLQEALADGYVGLRAAGEMGWALDGGVSFAALADYEDRLNSTVFPSGRLTGLCLYDAQRFPSESLRALEPAHPLVLDGRGASQSQVADTPPGRAAFAAERAGPASRDTSFNSAR